jgi:hypothetical protein
MSSPTLAAGPWDLPAEATGRGATSGVAASTAVLLLCGLALALDVLLGQFVLLSLGIRYQAEGGNPLLKIHPSSYLVLAAAALHVLAGRAPLRAIGTSLRGAPEMCLYVVCMAVVLAYALAVHGISGVAFLIDTFLIPGVLALLLLTATPRAQSRMVAWLILVLACNATLAIGEAAFHRHLFPYLINGQFVTDVAFRATAFAGHPLRNAMLTMMALLSVAARDWPAVIRAGFITVFAIALLAFGGRTAFAMAGAGLIALAVRAMAATARRDSAAFIRQAIAAFVVITGVVVSAIAIVAMTDFGSRIVDGSFGADSSSAARLQVFQIFAQADGADLLTGYSGETIDAMTSVIGLIAIENFWLYMFLFLGLIGSLIWLPAMLTALSGLWRQAGFAGRVVLVCGMIAASGNNSLAKKDSSLAVLFAFVIGGSAELGKRAGAAGSQLRPAREANDAP